LHHNHYSKHPHGRDIRAAKQCIEVLEKRSWSILETSKLLGEYSRFLLLLGKAESEDADDHYIEILRDQLKLAKDRIKMNQKREEERNISGRW
jgi:hypothetical protein